MKLSSKTLILFLLTSLFYGCKSDFAPIIDAKDVSPWCIIGFDTKDRTPQQRIDLLKELGLSNYGFNKGKGDFSTMKTEFKLAKENGIAINSIFLWLNAKRDSIGKLSPSNQLILDNLKEIDNKPTIWVSFAENFFEGNSQENSIAFSIEMIKYIKTEAVAAGCELALYNHRGWFGNPHHQVEILEKLDDESLSMVYNFHHAHEFVDEFVEVAKMITPYLSFVNLNGVKKDGPEIMDLGKGDYEIKMIKHLLDNGYDGPWGILGHVKTEDVKEVLKRNLAGLDLVNTKLAGS